MARFTVLAEPAAQAMPQPLPERAPSGGGRYIVHDPEAPSPFLRGALAGATMEWDDELGGLLGMDKEELRASKRAAADAGPGRYQAGKLTGAVASSLLPAGWLVKGGAGLMGVAKSGALLGGSMGATEALGEHEGQGRDAVTEALDAGGKMAVGGGVGALAGGTLSPMLYGLLAGVRGGGRFLSDWAQGNNHSALRKTEEALRRQGTEPAALADALTAEATPAVRGAKPEVLADVLRHVQTGKTATEAAKAVNASHGSGLAAQDIGRLHAGFTRANPVPRDLIKLSEEVGGGEAGRSGLTGLMQGVASLPGRGREVALRNMGGTMEAAPERMASRLSSETGADLNFRRDLANRQLTRKSAANKAYNEAYKADAGVGGDLRDDLQPILTGYALQAQQLGGETGSRIAQGVQMMTGARPGSSEFGVNSLQRYHEARKTLDSFIRANSASASPDWNAARLLGQMRRELNATMHTRNPRFKTADERFASDAAREEAMTLGRTLNFRSGEKQDEVLDAIRTLEKRNPTHAEELRDLFMQGALRRMADEVEISGGIPARWVQPLTGGVRPAPRQALEEALGAPLPGAPVASRANAKAGVVAGQPVPHQAGRETAQGVAGVLDDEARLKKIFTDVFGNSNTANKLAAQEDLRALPGIASELATGGLGGLKNAITKRLLQAMTEKNTEQIARIVTETDPRVLYVALRDIQRMAPKIRAGEQVMGAPALALGAGTGQSIAGN